VYINCAVLTVNIDIPKLVTVGCFLFCID